MTVKSPDKCGSEFCDDPATVTLINGAERTRYCDHCFRDVAGELAFENDDIHFAWDADHLICELA